MKAIVGKITDEVKQQAKSRIVKTNTLAIIIMSVASSMTYLEPFFTADEFGKILAIVGFVTSIANIYFRQSTSVLIKDK